MIIKLEGDDLARVVKMLEAATTRSGEVYCVRVWPSVLGNKLKIKLNQGEWSDWIGEGDRVT